MRLNTSVIPQLKLMNATRSLTIMTCIIPRADDPSAAVVKIMTLKLHCHLGSTGLANDASSALFWYHRIVVSRYLYYVLTKGFDNFWKFLLFQG
jgi:hypothetical protein